MYDLINTTDKYKTYIIESDYSVTIIKPLEAKIENSTVNINFFRM